MNFSKNDRYVLKSRTKKSFKFSFSKEKIVQKWEEKVSHFFEVATLNLGKLFTLLLIEKEQLRISKYGVEKPGYEIRYLFSTIELINFQNFQRLRLRCKYFTEGMYTK